MTRKSKTHTSKYRRHRRTRSKGQAFVGLDGERQYLGVYDSPESREAYHRLLAEWSANGRSVSTPRGDITVVEVSSRYLQYAHLR